MSFWDAACDMIKAVDDDEDEVEKGPGAPMPPRDPATSSSWKTAIHRDQSPTMFERASGQATRRSGTISTKAAAPKKPAASQIGGTGQSSGIGGTKGDAMKRSREGAFRSIRGGTPR